MGTTRLRGCIEMVADRMIAEADALTALDQAIGDGDHGINMRRGAEAVLAELDAISSKPLPEALKLIGTTLVMKVGGASGPLYGTLFLTLAKTLPEAPTLREATLAFGASIDAVKARGKSEPGQKTLLDVLVPVHAALESGRALGELTRVAQEAAEATVPLRAIRGRASFLGDRSIGHMDPGARSVALMVGTLCEALQRADAA